MNRHSVHALIALASSASACRPTPAAQAPAHCASIANATLAVSEQGFGGLSFDSSLGSLKHQCPAARDTILYGYEGHAVALLLSFEGASLLAYQSYRDTLDPRQPGDFWSISGDSVRLPRGLTLKSSWAAFRSAYGARGAIAADSPNNDTEWVSFAFCSMPHLTFEFPLPAAGAITDPDNGDISPDSVPPHPHITSVGLDREPERWLVTHCQ
jgi:hypothetical protein